MGHARHQPKSRNFYTCDFHSVVTRTVNVQKVLGVILPHPVEWATITQTLQFSVNCRAYTHQLY